MTAGLAHHDLSLENICLRSNQDQEEVAIIDLGMCMQVPKPAATTPTDTTTTTSLPWMDAVSTSSGGRSRRRSSPVLLAPQRCRGKAAYVVSTTSCGIDAVVQVVLCFSPSYGASLYCMIHHGEPRKTKGERAGIIFITQNRKEIMNTFPIIPLLLLHQAMTSSSPTHPPFAFL